MARYRIREANGAVLIELSEAGSKKGQFLEAFGECRDGRCECPTDEYDKVASTQIESDSDSIRVRLDTRPGEKLDPAQIETCLDRTVEKLR